MHCNGGRSDCCTAAGLTTVYASGAEQQPRNYPCSIPHMQGPPCPDKSTDRCRDSRLRLGTQDSRTCRCASRTVANVSPSLDLAANIRTIWMQESRQWLSRHCSGWSARWRHGQQEHNTGALGGCAVMRVQPGRASCRSSSSRGIHCGVAHL
jgi:hypothetical protein